MKACNVTLFTSSKPLAKVWTLGEKGPEKTTAAVMVEGSYLIHSVRSMRELAELLFSIRLDQALCASVPLNGVTSGRVVPKGRVGTNPGAVSRSKDCFDFQVGSPTLISMDYDPPGEVALSENELLSPLIEACPALSQAGIVHWCSGSSHIFNGESQVHGLRGQRLYFVGVDGSDLKRFATTLDRRLWLSGHGRIDVSTSGALLPRGLFDMAMFQPARLDFIGGADCRPPMSQRRGEPHIVNEGGWLDTRAAMPSLTPEEEGRYQALVQQAKEGKRLEAEQKRVAHRVATIAMGVHRLMKDEGITASEAEERIGSAVDAAHDGLLLGDFVLTVVHDNGNKELVTVAQVLSQRARYHEKDCLVPLNPAHRGFSPDARLFLNNASPILYSLDDGPQVYRLRRQRDRIHWGKGQLGQLIGAVSVFLARQDDVFNTDAGPVRYIDGRTVDLNAQQVRLLVSQRVVLLTRGPAGQDVPVELGREPADLVLANMRVAANELGVKRLTQVHSLPCAVPNGRVLGCCGWDAETGVYLHLPFDYVVRIPATPTSGEVRAALAMMASPFAAYKWATPDDAAGILSAVMTAVCRPFMRIAPMFVVDASTPGSGKTKAATALGSLMTGRHEGVTPFAGPNDDELRKRLMAGVLSGQRFHCLDNLTGFFKSAVLSGVLTSGRLNDRKLGVSSPIDGECKALMTATANNVSLDADLLRRTVRLRIDSGSKPTERLFRFDPVDVAIRDRVAIAEAVCVLLKAYFNAGAPRIAQDDAGGFGDWVRLCRQPLLWAQREGLTDALGWTLGDAAGSMMVNAEQLDPETEALSDLLRASLDLSNGEPFTAGTLLHWWRQGESAAANDSSADLREAVSELMPGRKDMTARTLGRALSNRRDRWAAGLCLRQRRDVGANSNVFFVERLGIAKA